MIVILNIIFNKTFKENVQYEVMCEMLLIYKHSMQSFYVKYIYKKHQRNANPNTVETQIPPPPITHLFRQIKKQTFTLF